MAPVSSPLELSVVIPCLNESETIGTCVTKAITAMRQHGICGEVIVSDNGSRDGSQAIAEKAGARIVEAEARGYGNALRAGIASARGKWVIMGDADDSYDFSILQQFVEKLREGYDLVQGCRLPSGGGTVMPGAMPFLHRWLGNPALSWLVRKMFHAPIHDIYCGYRGFDREFYEKLGLGCSGMEFATEMIIQATFHKGRIANIPITLHPDGRITGRPHLRTFRDGWRTLRFFLIYSPRWLFLYPSIALIGVGFLGYLLALPSLTIGGITFEGHTLLVATLCILLGHQLAFFSVITKSFAIHEGFLPMDRKTHAFRKWFALEKGIISGGVMMMAGMVLVGCGIWQWREHDFGNLDYAKTMKLLIPAILLIALGFQTFFSSFLVNIVALKRS
ncbi:MAG TPA: glycosyltransferase family 2 protein [Chthoniobacteraceae bacterium]|nr:glycosyltransferase family 2 protein [Chthoniobacteraceae bacterium]